MKEILGTIEMDIHEDKCFKEYLEDLGWTVIRKTLKVADFTRGQVAVEHKSINDFAGSLFGSRPKGKLPQQPRLWKQIINMKNNYKKPYLAVDGTIAELRDWKHEKPVLAALATIQRSPSDEDKHGFGIPVLQADTKRQLAYEISEVMKDIKETDRPTRITRKQPTIKIMKEDMLVGIKGIGLQKAKRLLEAGKGTIEGVICLDEEQLVEILGKTTGEVAWGVLHE